MDDKKNGDLGQILNQALSLDQAVLKNGHLLVYGLENGSLAKILKNGQQGLTSEIDSKGVSKRNWTDFDKDTIRLIGLFLSERGLHNVHDLLAESAGFKLELPEAHELRTAIFHGKYDQALICLEKILKILKDNNEGLSKNDIKRIKYHIGVQQYLEFLEKGDRAAALKCLRSELIGIHKINPDKVKELSKCLMFKNMTAMQENSKLIEISNWPGSGLLSRQNLMKKIQAYLPSHALFLRVVKILV